jgi:hypothetical protein
MLKGWINLELVRLIPDWMIGCCLFLLVFFQGGQWLDKCLHTSPKIEDVLSAKSSPADSFTVIGQWVDRQMTQMTDWLTLTSRKCTDCGFDQTSWSRT